MEYFLINHIMLRKYNFHDHKSVATPFDSSVHLFPMSSDDEIFNLSDYASLVVCIMLLIVLDLTLYMQ